MEKVRGVLRVERYAYATEKTYVHWIIRYIRFHRMRHPAEMGEPEVKAFLTHLAVRGNVSPATQTQALCPGYSRSEFGVRARPRACRRRLYSKRPRTQPARRRRFAFR